MVSDEQDEVPLNGELKAQAQADPVEVVPGLWSWAARHPEWHPGEFGAEVVSFGVRAGEDSLLIDPLLPEGAGGVAALIDRLSAARRIAILVTIPYHLRSAEPIRERWGDRVEVSIHGHRACRKRMSSERGFVELEPGTELPGGAVGYAIGKPRRFEHPLHLPSHDAVAFGDALAGTGGGLRMWSERPIDARHKRFYRERFAPTLGPLAELRPRHVLVGHGASAIGDGAEQLDRAIAAEPWYHRG